MVWFPFCLIFFFFFFFPSSFFFVKSERNRFVTVDTKRGGEATVVVVHGPEFRSQFSFSLSLSLCVSVCVFGGRNFGEPLYHAQQRIIQATW